MTMETSFVSDYQSPTIVEPRKASFDAPPLGVTGCRKARRLTAFSAPFVSARRNTRFDSAIRQLTPESGTVETKSFDQLSHSGLGASALLFLDGDPVASVPLAKLIPCGCAL